MDALNKDHSSNKVSLNSEDSTDFRNFLTVLYYCAMIIALPISTFFCAQFLLFNWALDRAVSVAIAFVACLMLLSRST